jgi:hypothetical protein
MSGKPQKCSQRKFTPEEDQGVAGKALKDLSGSDIFLLLIRLGFPDTFRSGLPEFAEPASAAKCG